MINTELAWWQGDGGNAYMQRCTVSYDDISKRRRAWEIVLSKTSISDGNVLEIGPGPGANLLALRHVLPNAKLFGIEPNAEARKHLTEICPFADIQDGHAAKIQAASESFDLVFTAGVLIHIHPGRLNDAIREIVRLSRGYVLAIEYFAPQCEPVHYYGDNRIWRNDFGSLYSATGLIRHVAHGFLWKPETAFDNTVWWLMEKE